jgi:hypothetical protein
MSEITVVGGTICAGACAVTIVNTYENDKAAPY